MLDALARLCVGRRPAPRGGGLARAPPGDDSRDRPLGAPHHADGARHGAARRAATRAARARYLSEGLSRDPAGTELRSLLAQLYRAASDWELLAPLLTAGVDYTTDRALQVEYLRDAAEVRRDRLGQLA